MREAAVHPSAVVFLHGVGGAARAWAPQMQSFASAGFAPVALDLPGYGARPPVAEMHFDELAADVEAAIAERGLQRPVLVGHSLGGMVAQTMLRRRPDGYAAAVLCCTSPAFGNPSGDFQKKFVADRLAPLESGKRMADLAAGIIGEIVGPAPDAAGRSLRLPAWARCRPRRIAPRCNAWSVSTSAPTLLPSGSRCFAFPASMIATRRRR